MGSNSLQDGALKTETFDLITNTDPGSRIKPEPSPESRIKLEPEPPDDFSAPELLQRTVPITAVVIDGQPVKEEFLDPLLVDGRIKEEDLDTVDPVEEEDDPLLGYGGVRAVKEEPELLTGDAVKEEPDYGELDPLADDLPYQVG